MHNIVDEDERLKISQRKKISKIITNLYEYKSNVNYSNRMKMVNNVIKKQK